MRQYVIASHGNFAKGIYEGIKIILGEQKNVTLINAYVDSNDLGKLVKDALNNFNQDDDIIVCTDLFGGSVNNEFMKYMDTNNYYLITNVNLPLLLQLFLSPEEDTEKMIQETLSNNETVPLFCNPLFKKSSIEAEDF